MQFKLLTTFQIWVSCIIEMTFPQIFRYEATNPYLRTGNPIIISQMGSNNMRTLITSKTLQQLDLWTRQFLEFNCILIICCFYLLSCKARGQVLGEDGVRIHSLVLPGLPSSTSVYFSRPGEVCFWTVLSVDYGREGPWIPLVLWESHLWLLFIRFTH